jgi:hypothetical protein
MFSARASTLLAALLMVGCFVDPPAAVAEKQADPQPQPEPAPQKPADPNALTPEEEALIAQKPADLTPEQRVKRAHALRKKIMQNPDSEAAKALEDARRAAEAGEINIPGKPDNGLVIPLPDHLKNQDQSVGKPAE